MIKDLWINLPVRDIKRSKDFFSKLGFTFNTKHGNSPNSLSLLVGEKNVVVMLFDEATFKGFTNSGISDSKQSAEVLLSIGADSIQAVDEIAKKAVEAGGESDHKPYEMKGWMYGCIFSDPDGHRWNVLYMDMSKMPK